MEATSDHLNQKGKTMTKQETLGQIAELEAQIKAATKERDALRLEAVSNGWAMWTYTIRQSAPSLAWWKENRPTVWQKYAKETTVKKFTIA
jgi:alpha-L-arabinofuranosidase